VYADVLPGAWQDYLILEAFATKISAYEPQRIPALLQTPAYARELAEADPALVGSDARDSAVAAVLARFSKKAPTSMIGRASVITYASCFCLCLLSSPVRDSSRLHRSSYFP